MLKSGHDTSFIQHVLVLMLHPDYLPQCCYINCFRFRCPWYTLSKFLRSFFIFWQKITQKLLQLASRHFSQRIIEGKWKHMFVLCAHSILVLGNYLMNGNIISWRNIAAVVVCFCCLEDNLSIELVIWWEWFFHFWARTVNEIFGHKVKTLHDQLPAGD